jgi:glycosyltransferase involved in cell wall biosynthesis
MVSTVAARSRVAVDGKFFRLGESKFYVKGVAYGPFAPDAQGRPFASPEQTKFDLAQIRELGANLLRIYHVPPRWFLDLAEERQLKVLVDIPWNKHLCFDSPRRRSEARDAVRRAVESCAPHPAVFAYSVVNEIPPDIVRWTGPKSVAGLIDELVGEAKRADPGCLCTFTNFPPTEFLRPHAPDFVCFNVYLHHEAPFRNYLSRLQMLADSKPLLLGEIGIDSIREGDAQQCRALAWQIENAFRGGLAGAIVFTYTDEWFRDGRLIEDWKMGLVTSDRRAKESFAVVRNAFQSAPYFPLARCPKVSVVIACYNGSRTLLACLESLKRLNYPDYEIILVDDGSTDSTREIAARFPEARYCRHDQNRGLSAARNTGLAAARGEVIAFTDADCRADEDWLHYLVGDLLRGSFVGIGGPNLLPPEDSDVASAVMVSPGGPAHVMLTDRTAEHIPGCNMAFYKWVLEEIGGFDPMFRKAGDDVDLCWRLQQGGYQIGFSPAGFVWHYRRSTVRAYLQQQRGYGEAEALLVQKHPENFNAFGNSIWRGRIYGPSKFGLEIQAPVIYHGFFGSAGFQKLYASEPAGILMLCTSPGYYLFVLFPLCVLSVIWHPLALLAVVSLVLPLGVCAAAGAQAALPPSKTQPWSRPLVSLLFLLQPIVRGWARYQRRIAPRPSPLAAQQSLDSLALRSTRKRIEEVQYWADKPIERLAMVALISQRLDQKGWSKKADIGWSDYDLEIYGSRWSHLHLTTVVEDHPPGRRLLRCRLRTRWSPAARTLFWSAFGADLLLIGLVTAWRPWSWLLLLTLPLLIGLLWRDQRNLQSVLSVLLDELGRDYELVKVRQDANPVPASAGLLSPP